MSAYADIRYEYDIDRAPPPRLVLTRDHGFWTPPPGSRPYVMYLPVRDEHATSTDSNRGFCRRLSRVRNIRDTLDSTKILTLIILADDNELLDLNVARPIAAFVPDARNEGIELIVRARSARVVPAWWSIRSRSQVRDRASTSSGHSQKAVFDYGPPVDRSAVEPQDACSAAPVEPQDACSAAPVEPQDACSAAPVEPQATCDQSSYMSRMPCLPPLPSPIETRDILRPPADYRPSYSSPPVSRLRLWSPIAC